MKIVIDYEGILPYALGDPKAVGGSERQIWLLVRALARRGHQLIIYDRVSQPRAEQVVEGVFFRWVTPRNPFVAWSKIMLTEKPDVWYWIGAEHHLTTVGLLARLLGVKLLLFIASDLDCQPRHALHRRAYLWPLYALGLRLAHRIVLLHEGQRALLAPALRAKARHVPSIAGAAPPVAERGNHVAWVAVLRQPKRAHLLPELAQLLPHIRFVVCGPTSLHRTAPDYAANLLARLAACPNIEYRGQVAPAEAQRVMSEAAVFLSTSSQEGVPNTFLQSWAAGVPVVSLELDPGGLIEQHAAGRVTHSLAECAQAIDLLVRDHALNRQLGENGRRFVEACHSEARAVTVLLTVLGEFEKAQA